LSDLLGCFLKNVKFREYNEFIRKDDIKKKKLENKHQWEGSSLLDEIVNFNKE